MLNIVVVFSLYALPVLLLTGTALLARRVWHRTDLCNPLTKGLLRPAGYSLQERLDVVRGDMMALMAVVTPIPLVALNLTSSSMSGRKGLRASSAAWTGGSARAHIS